MMRVILKHLGNSFLMGIVIMNLIAFFISSGNGNESFLAEEFVQMIGNPKLAMLLQILLTGVYGVCSIGGMLFYDIEHWSMLRSACVHYLLCMVAYAAISLFLCWFKPGAELVIMLIFMTVLYLLIWLSFYLYYQAQIRKINAVLPNENTKSC